MIAFVKELFSYVLGDPFQLRPLLTMEGKTTEGESIFELRIMKSLKHLTIKSQFRCDTQYLQFLGKPYFFHIILNANYSWLFITFFALQFENLTRIHS